MKKLSTRTLTIGAALTALVIILQFMGAFIRFGMFQVSLVLVPIVIGAAVGGVGLGTWLGFVFGMVVLLNGDAASFLAIDVFGTIITVLLKGTLCGLLAGVTYKYVFLGLNKLCARKVLKMNEKGYLCDNCTGTMTKYFSRNNQFVSILAAAVVCPIVNTGIFLLGCVLFFMPFIRELAAGMNVAKFMIVGFVGINFLIEMGINLLLSPVIVRLLNARKKQ